MLVCYIKRPKSVFHDLFSRSITWKHMGIQRVTWGHIEDITLWHEDISTSRRVMFFLLYRQKDIDKVIEGNDRNYIIDKLTCEIMENKPLESRM